MASLEKTVYILFLLLVFVGYVSSMVIIWSTSWYYYKSYFVLTVAVRSLCSVIATILAVLVSVPAIDELLKSINK